MVLAPPSPETLQSPESPALERLLNVVRGRRVVVLAGAGCSTESGIPDYRGPDASRRPRTPMQYQDFVRSEAARVRYWARSTLGWPRLAAARPNPAHFALARLERGGVVHGLISQNVDGLHHAAGSRRVVELHGSLGSVRCLACGQIQSRHDFQHRLLALNGKWAERLDRRMKRGEVAMAPDGDVELSGSALVEFRVPECAFCRGILKPDVVFFGENVPRDRVEECWTLFESAEMLLVVGSSLAVYSGRRFIYGAEKAGLPIGIVNMGPTRADEVACAKVEGRLGQVLPRLTDLLLGGADA
jgi:NAD+-dependent protein deacetylase sirtuin 4